MTLIPVGPVMIDKDAAGVLFGLVARVYREGPVPLKQRKPAAFLPYIGLGAVALASTARRTSSMCSRNVYATREACGRTHPLSGALEQA